MSRKIVRESHGDAVQYCERLNGKAESNRGNIPTRTMGRVFSVLTVNKISWHGNGRYFCCGLLSLLLLLSL